MSSLNHNSALKNAEQIIKEELVNSILQYLQSGIINDKKNDSIKKVNNTIIHLHDKLTQLFKNDKIFLKDLIINNFLDYSRELVLCLDKINYVSCFDYELNNETKTELKLLLNILKEWINWYSIIIPRVYNYLSSADPIDDFLAGITHNNFEAFLNLVSYKEPLIPDSVMCDPFKITQLNKLLENTWQDFMHHRIEIKNQGEYVFITGNCIKISEVEQYLIPNHVKILKIICFNTIHFDKDLKIPGASIIIIAPIWIINDYMSVNLSGNDAEHRLSQATDGIGYHGNNGVAGTDGLPGFSGQNGGCFYGNGIEFFGLTKFGIEIDGGNGGNGQDGGNGSEHLNSTNILSQSTEAMIGGFGGNAGLGGDGGIGGCKGAVQIFQGASLISNICSYILSSNGSRGNDGNVGIPGSNIQKTSAKNTKFHSNNASEHKNANKQQSLSHTIKTLETIKKSATAEFINHIEDMFVVEIDNILFKLQRPILEEWLYLHSGASSKLM